MEIADVTDGSSCAEYLKSLPADLVFSSVRYLAIHTLIWELPATINGLLDFSESIEGEVRLLPCLATALISVISFDHQRTKYGYFDFQEFLESTYQEVDGKAPAGRPWGFETHAMLAKVCSGLVVPRAVSDDIIRLLAHTSFHAYDDLYWSSVRKFLRLADKGSSIENFSLTLNEFEASQWGNLQERLSKRQSEKWTFWIVWFDRVISGQDLYPSRLVEIVDELDQYGWLENPKKVNARFDEVLAAYQKDEATLGGASDPHATTTLHVKAIRSQVSTLKEFLEAEYLKLSGHNARSPEQDDMLDLLRDIKGLVDDMLARFENAESDENAVAVVSESLPAVVEKAGELAVKEAEPQISATTITMTATIKSLTDGGADPKMATLYGFSDAAYRKLQPVFERLLPFGKRSGGS